MGRWVTRRNFIIAMAGLAAAGAGFSTFDRWVIDKILGRLKGKFSPPPKVLADSERALGELPPGGERVSVEMALNSRCNSDYGGNQQYMHWGIFDRDRTISDVHVQKVIEASLVPSFTKKRSSVSLEGRRLTFHIDSGTEGMERHHLMVENGMRQQAVSLVCAALGMGMVFRNLGMDGQILSAGNYGTVRMDLDAMKASYGDSFWTAAIPSDRKPWISGNLPDPHREGKKPLLQILESLDIRHEGKVKADLPQVGQLLWAARGRTPHLYKSKPWALTIPFWTDRIDVSSLYLIWNMRLHQYVNWEAGGPTHGLNETATINETEWSWLRKRFPQKDIFIVIGLNDEHNRAFWEIGYELLSMLVQAKASDLNYEALLLGDEEKSHLSQTGVKQPVAMLSL